MSEVISEWFWTYAAWFDGGDRMLKLTEDQVAVLIDCDDIASPPERARALAAVLGVKVTVRRKQVVTATPKQTLRITCQNGNLILPTGRWPIRKDKANDQFSDQRLPADQGMRRTGR